MTASNPFADLTLEDVVTGKGLADLPASPLQRAIVRAAQGRPVGSVIASSMMERCFGVPSLPPIVPVLVALVCGVRGGKSFLAACGLIWAALTADLSKLKLFEVARGVIIGPTVDAAHGTFVQLVGIIQSSAVLRALVVEQTADSITLRRPDGRLVELCVVAAHRGGLSVRNRWLVFVAVEEVAQFNQEAAGAVVNVEEIVRAAMSRLTPGGQVWLISSPYGPVGLLYETWKKHFGKPGRTLVVWAGTRDLNPSYPQEAIDALREEDPDTAAREHDPAWLDPETAFLGAALVDPAIRIAPLVRAGRANAAAGDFGTRGNSWTLGTAWCEPVPGGGDRRRVVVGGVWEWTGSKSSPLSPKAVFAEMAAILKPFEVRQIHVDSWSFDAMQDHARDVGLVLVEQPVGERDIPYLRLKTLLGNEDVELPPHPHVRADLVALRQRNLSGGAKIILARTPDGRHCDMAPTIALAVAHAERQGRGAVDWKHLHEINERLSGSGRGLNEPPLVRDYGGSRWSGSSGRGYG